MTENNETVPSANDRADEELEPQRVPSQQGSSGGNMARRVGQRDELKTGQDGDPLPTSVDGRDKADDGDMPTKLQTRK